MAPQASSVSEMSQETGPEQRPAGPHLALAGPSAAARQIPRPLEVAECAMCGIALPLALLVPDGGQACADIGWYCKDVRSCTERWTTALPSRHAYTPADHGNAGEDTGEASAEAASAKPLNGMLELAAPA
jgi:hypothetical protein